MNEIKIIPLLKISPIILALLMTIFFLVIFKFDFRSALKLFDFRSGRKKELSSITKDEMVLQGIEREVQLLNDEALKKRNRLEELLRFTAMPIKTKEEFFALSILTGFIISIPVFFTFESLYMGILFFVVGFTLPIIFINKTSENIKNKADKQVRDFIIYANQNVSTSKSAIDAVYSTIDSLKEPMKTIVAVAVKNSNNSIADLSKQFHESAERLDNYYLLQFALALDEHRESGLDFSVGLNAVYALSQQDKELTSDDKAKTLYGKISFYLLALLFLVMIFLLKVNVPEVFEPMMNTKAGRRTLYTSSTLVVINYIILSFTIRR